MKIFRAAVLAFVCLRTALLPAQTADAQLVNISTRGQVGTDANILICGFEISGDTKTVLVRAIGPGLGAFGVAGTLPDPTLAIYDSKSTVVASNDNWTASDAATMSSVGAFPLTPGSKDAVIVITLSPGAYTAHISGLGNPNTGVAILEVYAVSGGGQLINIATRLQVGIGSNAAVAGFVVSPGTGPRKLLVRGIGPALGAFGLRGVLPDPKLVIFDGTASVIASAAVNGHAPALTSANSEAGAFASTEGDAAAIVTVAPGNYTVQLSGDSGSTLGIGLIEVYDITTSTGVPVNLAKNKPTIYFSGLPPRARSPGSPPPAPASLSMTNVASAQITLDWPDVSGATSYKVKRSTTRGGPYTIIASSVAVSTYTNTGLTNGTTYYYVVTAVDSSGQESAPSPERGGTPGTFTNPPPPPQGFIATPGNAQVTLSWAQGPSGGPGYRIERSLTNGGTYTIIGYPNGPDFTNTGLTNGTTYYYKITTRPSTGNYGTAAGPISATPGVPPGAPTSLAATGGNAQVSLTWTASAGTGISYNVKRATASGGPYSVVTTGVSSTGYTDSGLTNGTTYYYVVSAVNTAGESANSNQAAATPDGPPAAPGSLAATGGNAQITLTWTASAGTGITYNLKRATVSGGPYATIATGVSNTSYTETELTNGTTYYYVATAVNTSGESANSNQATATPSLPPAAPGPLSMTNVASAQITLDWPDVSGATSYKVKRSTTRGGPYTIIASGVAVSTYTNTGLTNGTTYYYVVTAVNSSGQESTPSTERGGTPGTFTNPPPPPQGFIATPGNAQVTLSWAQGPSGGPGYRIERSLTSGGTYTIIGYPNGPDFTNTGLTNGTTYYYKITTRPSTGNYGTAAGPISATPMGPPAAPTSLAGTGGNAQVSLTWTAARAPGLLITSSAPRSAGGHIA